MPFRGKPIAVLAAALAVAVLGVAAWRWQHLRFWWLFEPVARNGQGYPEYRHRQTGIVFVRVPEGTFRMGSPEGEPFRADDEGPVHDVELSPFLIAKCEVTQAQWEHVMGGNPSEFRGADLPVERISWNDAREFCRKTGLAPPSEAQWEYACRGGTSGLVGGTGELQDMGWCLENSAERTHPAGSRQPNPFGLHDVHGNVWEWCEDAYDPRFYATPEACGDDPVCAAGSGHRVNRGGSWSDSASGCRSANRRGVDPAVGYHDLGFRPVFAPLP